MNHILKKALAITMAFLLATNVTTIQYDKYIYASEKVSENRLSTSNYKDGNITVVIKNNTLVFEDLPEEEGFREKILISLYRDKIENGKDAGETIGKQYITISTGAPVYKFSEVKEAFGDGSYYIQIYYLGYNASGKLTYKGYCTKRQGIKIKKTGNKAVLLEPEPYQSNLKLFQARTKSSNALAYYLEAENWVDCDNSAIKAKALEITRGITNDYDKVKEVYTWVADNIWYDSDGLSNGINGVANTEYIASEVLKSKKGVCQSYANISAALLRAVGIPTRVITGYGMGIGTNGVWTDTIFKGERNHAWNESYVDGRWVIFDTTWATTNKYENKIFSEGTGCIGYGNFDFSIERFSANYFIVDKEEKFLEATAKKLELATCKEYSVGGKGVIWKKDNTVPEFEYKFSGANENIATIDQYGVITGVSEGRVNITTTLLLNGNKKSFTVPINVNKSQNIETEVEAPVTEETKNEDIPEATVKPGTDEKQDESGSSSSDQKQDGMTNDSSDDKQNEADGSADDNSSISGGDFDKSEGIEGGSQEQGGLKDEGISSITPTKDIYDLLEEVTPSVSKVNLVYGGTSNNTYQLLYYFDSSIKGKFKITYWIEDSRVAKISTSGKITAKGAGETTLHITYETEDYQVDDTVDIFVKAAKINISSGNKKIKKGKTKTLSAKASNVKGTIKWKTSNKKIATVTAKGKVSAKKKGKVKITAYIGKVQGSVNITVY